MARMPGTNWLGEHAPIQSNGERLTISRYDIVCVHTIVGFAPAHAAHFSTHHDGRIDQSRDTKYRSGANLDGNHRIIAIENEDMGSDYGNWDVNDGHAVPAFTDAQVEAIAQVCAWAHTTHGIPLQPCPDSRPESRGIAYHRQGIDGNWSDYAYPGRVSGGEVWTTSPGKVCPGDRRITQTLERVIDRAKAIVAGEDAPVTNEEIQKIARAVWELTVQDKLREDIPDQPDGANRDTVALINALRTKVFNLTGKVDEILAKLDAPAPPPGTVTVGAFAPEALAAQAKANADETAARMTT